MVYSFIVSDWKSDSDKEIKNLCWMHSSLLVLVEVTEFHTTEAYCNLDLINVLYNIRMLLEEEKEKATVWINPKRTNC